jgi:hexosaminidase
MFPLADYPKVYANQSGDQGVKPPYTLQQLQDLENFSQAHGVTIIPEFESPGHAGQIVSAYPDTFSLNTGEIHCMNYAKPEVRAAVKAIISEILDVFTATPYFHMGGDEVRYWSSWKTPEFRAKFAAMGLPKPYEMKHSLWVYNDYIAELSAHVRNVERRTLIVWEFFRRDRTRLVPVPSDVVVMPFDNWRHTAWELVEDGFDIINAAWKPNYIAGTRQWTPQEIHAWDKFDFDHWHSSSRALGGVSVEDAYDAQIRGAIMCSWENPEAEEIPRIRSRLAPFAEKLWNPESGRAFNDFQARFQHGDMVLDKLLE